MIDIESLGGGAGAGLFGTFLGILGFSRRITKLENSKKDKEVCNASHKGIDDRFNTMIEVQKDVREELRDLNRYIRNKTSFPD